MNLKYFHLCRNSATESPRLTGVISKRGVISKSRVAAG